MATTWNKVSATIKKGIILKDLPEQIAVPAVEYKPATGNEPEVLAQPAIPYRAAILNRGTTDQLTYKLQEVVDGTPGKTFTLVLNAGHTKATFETKMKALILAERQKVIDETPKEEKIDVANFETFLNT